MMVGGGVSAVTGRVTDAPVEVILQDMIIAFESVMSLLTHIRVGSDIGAVADRILFTAHEVI